MLLYCFYYILLKTVPLRSDPIRFKWVLHIGSKRNGSLNRTVKIIRSEYSHSNRRRAHLIPIRKPHNNFQLLRFILLLRSSILKKHDESFCNYFHFRKEYRERNSRFFYFVILICLKIIKNPESEILRHIVSNLKLFLN